jgi:hypothetical protein
MNGLRVGGSQSPNLINTSNALLYAFMAVTCFAEPWLTNVIGFRYTITVYRSQGGSKPRYHLHWHN